MLKFNLIFALHVVSLIFLDLSLCFGQVSKNNEFYKQPCKIEISKFLGQHISGNEIGKFKSDLLYFKIHLNEQKRIQNFSAISQLKIQSNIEIGIQLLSLAKKEKLSFCKKEKTKILIPILIIEDRTETSKLKKKQKKLIRKFRRKIKRSEKKYQKLAFSFWKEFVVTIYHRDHH